MVAQQKWGGEHNSKDYELFMAGETPFDEAVSLTGHAMTSMSDNLTDPVEATVVEKVNGRMIERTRIIRTAIKTSMTFTLVMSSDGRIWTPALHRARTGGTSCRTTFFAKRLCSDPREQHVYAWPESTMNPPTRVNDFITIEDTTLADWQSECRADREILVWATGIFKGTDLAGAAYDVAYIPEECSGCGTGAPHSKLVAVGGDGTTEPLLILITEDRFASVTSVANDAPAGSIGRSVYADGNFILVGFSDAADLSGTAGGTLVSNDGGATFELDHATNGITLPILTVGRYGGKFYAAGGTTGGQAVLYQSNDGVNWTSITSAALPADAAITSMAVDDAAGVFYLVGENGLVLKGEDIAGTISLSTMTPDSSSGVNMLSVHVISEDRIAIGGAGGYYAETINGGASWYLPTISGTADIVNIHGDSNRLMFASGTKITTRDLISDNNFKSKTPEFGETIAGNVRGVAMPVGDVELGFNYGCIVTDTGEVFIMKPFYPGA